MRKHRLVLTRDREQTAWEMLRWFESHVYVKSNLNERYPGVLSNPKLDEKAAEVTAYATQAREYFEAARAVTLATQPTLIYYGMANLAAAIALCSDARKRQANLAGAHGLTRADVGCTTAPDLPQVALGVEEKGTFRELLQAVPADYYAFGAQVVRFLLRGPTMVEVAPGGYGPADARELTLPRKGAVSHPSSLRLGDLLHMIPDLACLAREQYRDWPEQPVPVESYDIQMSNSSGARLRLSFKERERDAAHPLLIGLGYEEIRIGQYLSPELDKSEGQPLSRLVEDHTGQFFIYPCGEEPQVPRLAAYLAIAFALGFLARYRPRHWAVLISGTKSPAVHVIRRFMYLAFDEFPALALCELSDEHIRFSKTWKM